MQTKKLTIIGIILLLGISFALLAGNNFYTNSWERVRDFENRSLPQSALNEVEEIYNTAIEEQNIPQVIKALIHKMRFENTITDSWYNIFSQLELLAENSQNDTEKAILHSMLAEMYMQFLASNRFSINQRTAIIGFVPERMDEWSENIFVDRFLNHIRMSLQPAAVLQKTDVLQYEEILILGADSRNLRPTLYNFLAFRALQLLAENREFIDRSHSDKNMGAEYFGSIENFIALQIDSASNSFRNITTGIFQQLLKAHSNDPKPDALLHADLERISFVFNNTDESLDSLYLNYLLNLKEKFATNPLLVEVKERLASYYISQASLLRQILAHQPDNNNEEIRRMINEYYIKANNICREGIERFPDYGRINILRNLQLSINESWLRSSTNMVTYPNANISFSIDYRNLQQVTLNIYRVNMSIEEFTQNSQFVADTRAIQGDLVFSRTVDLPQKEQFVEQSTTIEIPGFNYGIYMFEIIPADVSINSQRGAFYVSKFALIGRGRDNNLEYFVVDRISGQPQQNVALTIFRSEFVNRRNQIRRISRISTDASGYASYSSQRGQQLLTGVSAGNDVFHPLISNFVAWRSDANEANRATENVSIFTDRAIYRPGQRVHFKAIANNQTTTNVEVIAGREFKVRLFDANWQAVDSLSLTSNEFGSFAGEFVLPQNVLSGIFNIMVNDHRAFFRVEEYRRPTIEINLENIKTAYTFGDSIVFNGSVMNYAGHSAQYAEVRFRVVKEAMFFRFRQTTSEELANGTTQTDANGRFSIDFQLPQEVANRRISIWGYNYILHVEATDNRGETQRNQLSFNILPQSIIIESNLLASNFVKKNSDRDITISARNANGVALSPVIEYEIFALQARKSLTDTSSEIAALVLSGSLDLASNSSISNYLLSALESGRYKIRLTAKDHKGRANTIEREFLLYDINDQTLPDKIHIFADDITTEFSEGESAKILFGTAAENVKVLFQIMRENRVLESRWLDFDNEMRVIEIPYRREFGNAVDVELLFVRNEQFFRHSVRLNKKEASRELDIRFTTFRDKLLPGEQEEWTVKISDRNGNIVDAEFLATLFDASLDALARNTWHFSPAPRTPSFFITPWRTDIFGKANSFVSFDRNFNEVRSLDFDQLNWFGLNFRSDHFWAATTPRAIPSMAARGGMQRQAMFMSMSADMAVAEVAEEAANYAAGITAENNFSPRTDFSETAFFLPQLRTNENGEVLLSFTMPESVTRWNFMGLAHTKDLKYGQILASIVTQKPFMIRPNLPRFARVNDEMILVAEIVNLTEQNIEGEAVLEVINPVDNEVVARKVTNFNVNSGSNITVNWDYNVTNDFDLLIFRFTANNYEFSDGEQHLIPILSNKILVTESMPMTVRGAGTNEFIFDRFIDNRSPSLENISYTIRFASNPAWYAVLALPHLSVTPESNAISLFSAYYANTLASFILNSNPRIAEVFEMWRNEENPTSLLSKLEQNEELKSLLLRETPWVLSAQNETEQMQQIASFFDSNTTAASAREMLGRLQQLQLSNGAFPWFNGMSENRFVTQFIMSGMAKLRNMNAVNFTRAEENMQRRAIAFMDLCIKDDFDRLRRQQPNNYRERQNLSAIQIHYHYVRSSFPNIPIPADTRAAFQFYLEQMERYWTQRSLYEQAMIATVMFRQGNREVALNIINSLREHATVSEEMGMYWAQNRSSFLWHQSAIQTQVALIEAFAVVVGNKEEIDNMKIWLLRQKQTQMWDSNISTVNAVYALLMQGSNWLENNEDVRISVGGRELVQERTAGIGYFKKTFANDEITPELGNISITKKDDGIAWGAAFWQYLEDVDKIENREGYFSVEKKLFVERRNERGRFLEPVEEGTPLRIGDKVIVRLTIRADRDFEFVHLRDLRASTFEPVEQISGFRWGSGIGFFQSTRDNSMEFFFDHLPRGTYVLEYGLWVARSGEFSNGIATIQSLYAPEFVNHTGSVRLVVD